jgi:hypothetical protein
VVNIANDMCLRLEKHLSSLNRAFDFTVYNHALGCDGSGDMSSAGDDEGVQCSSPSIWPLTSTKPSAVTLPTIFNPLAITVPRCFDANMVTSYEKNEHSSAERLWKCSDEALHRFALVHRVKTVVVWLRFVFRITKKCRI